MADITRRGFLRGSAATTAGAVASTTMRPGAIAAPNEQSSGEFASDWKNTPDRIWPGPEYWTNPLQDWRVAGGRLECIHAAPDRNVHLLTRDLKEGDGDLRMSVKIGRVDGAFGEGKGSAGFSIGVKGPLDDYRNRLVHGSGLDVGLTADGRLFMGGIPAESRAPLSEVPDTVRLELTATPNAKTSHYHLTLKAVDPATGKELGQLERDDVPADRLVGNLALAANFGSGVSRRGRRGGGGKPAGTGRFWFSEWTIEGSKVALHAERAFGPILFNQYTLSNRVMKMTVQMPPWGEEDPQVVYLSVKDGKVWRKVGEAKIDPESRTATFRIENWDATKDHYYVLASGPLAPPDRAAEQPFFGTIRKDPVDKEELVVADLSCNGHQAFPNAEYAEKLAKLNPDLLAAVGDQFYESSGGYGVVREPVDMAIVDYLRKWYLHGWTFRELMRDRPSIALPDDHDVYQGNIWGEEGAPQTTTQEAGGYRMDPAWVNVVHRTQTSHHPDAFDPEPVQQGITVYYGPLTYGRVSFAVLADRQFKTAPEGVAPPTESGRADHVIDPNFDPESANVPGAQMLGERQLAFLREWAADWRGADMKSVISQTIFTSMATHHGRQHMRLIADYDSNGWPQTARDAALREIRKAFAFHIAGDQHLPAVVHYGIDEHGDAGVALAGPPTNTTYPRWWEPEEPGENRPDGAPKTLGEFTDHFGNPLTVLAVKNQEINPGKDDVLKLMNQKASGLGVVRFNKPKRTITIECWPYLADFTDPKAQWEDWPVTVSMLDNYGRKPLAYLPTFEFTDNSHPVVQVRDESNEIIYTLRPGEKTFQPHVFAEGNYKVIVSEPESDRSREYTNLKANAKNNERIQVSFE